MSDADIVDYYSDLLILQYRDKPKAIAHIAALLDILIINELINDVSNGYSIDAAIGAQQDVISKYLGTSRTVTGVDFTRNYYGFETYDGVKPLNAVGFGQYGVESDGSFKSYRDEESSRFDLNDEELREVHVAAVVANNSNLSTANVDRLIFDVFDGNVEFSDNQDMSVNYVVPADQSRLVEIIRSQDLIPRAMGVSVIVSFS